MLPISVIVPYQPKREFFFREFCLPSIERNEPYEIIIRSEEGGPAVKRNAGAKISTQKYLYFCDDDIILPENHFNKLLKGIENEGYAYTDYYGIVMDAKFNTEKTNYLIKAKEFDLNQLKIKNYISTMSLIRRDVFCGFDEQLHRLQDWDLWLTLAEKGIYGKYIPDTYFYAFYLDEGITCNSNDRSIARNIIRQKHGI